MTPREAPCSAVARTIQRDPLPRFGDRRRIRVGLLGGSFNPAHAGHLHVARAALKRLRLDQVWLLVSPGNPLKPKAGMAPLAIRLTSAGRIADGRRIVATAIEGALGTRYTADTISVLQRRFPRVRFVWLMGADNLVQLPRWDRWQRIAADVPLAVLPRPGATRKALASRAAHALGPARRIAERAPALATLAPPCWCLLPIRENPLSATALRNGQRACTGDDP